MHYSLQDFDYHLPLQLIAQYPSKPRDHSRLLLLNKESGQIQHDYFYNIINHLQAGDVLVLNNSKVFPARLKGKKIDTGGSVEVFLHQEIKDGLWNCLLKGRIKVGLEVEFAGGLKGETIKDNNDGTWQVRFNYQGNKFIKTINRIGQVPLPPYIKREKTNSDDKKDYQTVFADPDKVGSVAAPTAGLHFTKKLIKQLSDKKVKIIEATLHVGLGTFAPVKTDKIEDHKMHSEYVEVKKNFIRELKKAKKEKRRVIAVGTTSCRILESLDIDREESQVFWTDIFIYPGYRFKVVDALITNFHLPKSSLLMLVSALAGKDNIDKTYKEAVKQKYRFFSYGDAMIIY